MPLLTETAAPVTHHVDIKSKIDVHHVELRENKPEKRQAIEAKPPVDDNFMYDFKYNHPLPTSDVLGIEIPADCDAQKEAQSLFVRLEDVMSKGDANAFADLFLESGTIASQLKNPFLSNSD